MKYYLSLDNGGTVTKAAIYDLNGTEKGVVTIATEAIAPKAGYVERDMEEMWEANCRVIQEVLKQSKVNPDEIAAIAVCGHGKGLYLWGKDDKPARRGIISTDNRAWEYPLKWLKDGTEDRTSKLACQHIYACQPVSLLAWMKDHEPQSIENVKWIFEAKDYVRFRLTGEARAELSDYSGANLINLHTRNYDRELMDLFGIGEFFEMLPPLCNAFEICGYVTEEAAKKTGLRKGTPVAGGLFDIDACMLAANILTEKEICMIAGTWSVNLYLNKRPIEDRDSLMHMMNTLFAMPEYYLIEESSPTSAGNNEWFLQTLLPELISECKKQGKSVYSIVNEWVSEIGVNEYCPIFLPFVMGSNAHVNAKGSFVGITNCHTRRHLARSVYEGIAFCHRVHLERLRETYVGTPTVIRLTGGAAKSKVWAQMFADVKNMTVETVDTEETGTFGCAIVAAVAAGDYPDIKSAALKMCKITNKYYPIAENVKAYDRKYILYRKTVDALDGVWDEFQELMDN